MTYKFLLILAVQAACITRTEHQEVLKPSSGRRKGWRSDRESRNQLILGHCHAGESYRRFVPTLDSRRLSALMAPFGLTPSLVLYRAVSFPQSLPPYSSLCVVVRAVRPCVLVAR
jgi:hypothetical protein